MKLKNLPVVLLAVVLAFLLCACGVGDSPSPTTSPVPSSIPTSKPDSSEPVSTGTDPSASEEPEVEEPSGVVQIYSIFEVVLPDGWEYYDSGSGVFLLEIGGRGQIQFATAHAGLTAEEMRAYDEEENKKQDRPFTILPDMTFGEYTYLAAEFEWNGEPSTRLYLDISIGRDKSVRITFNEISSDDPIIAEVMGTIAYITD